MKTTFGFQSVFSLIALTFCLGAGMTTAQVLNSALPASKKDTVSVFGNRLKISLAEGSIQNMPTEMSANKFTDLFNLHDITKTSGFTLRAKDTLVFYLTSIDRPTENDGGIATWEVINSFLNKEPTYRMESGWKKLGRDYLYFVKLVINAKPRDLFEFNFFFIDNKLAFSLHQRSVIMMDSTELESYTLITAR